jgi:general secretion pathway protein G
VRIRVKQCGFTLIEILVVMAIVAMLITLAVPRYFGSLEKSKETVLRETLATTRDALDKFYADNGKYPDSLDVLVSKKYLRAMPFDPVTDSNATWAIIPPDDVEKGLVADIRSGAEGNGRDGKPFKEL